MKIRKPAVAGQFYPGSEHELRSMLENMFMIVEKDKKNIHQHVSGIIAPHAGYVYSGIQAAKAYQYIKHLNYDLVCIISPSHRSYFQGVSVYPHDAYATPLGLCKIHKEARQLLLDGQYVNNAPQPHAGEHALEVQLPFIQFCLGNIPILPLIMGDQGPENIDLLAKELKELFLYYGDRILFIASTDLSHFYPLEFAQHKDLMFVDLLKKADAALLLEKLTEESVEACGSGPLLALMKALNIDKEHISTLGYSHSGQVSGDNSSVVGYCSALLFKN